MGVDATLFVVATYGPFVKHVLDLERERSLWPSLSRLEASGSPVGRIRLPGSSGEHGHYIQGNPYGCGFSSFPASELAGLRSESTFNAAAMAFVAEHFGDQQVIVYWH